MAELSEMQETLTYDDCREEHIRLTRITRNHKGGVSLQIRTFSVDQTPDYTALSYQWRDPHRENPVEANGKKLGITRSLKDFFEEVCARQADAAQPLPLLSGWFWIDAICINQESDEDRSRQVRRMKEIYDGARRIIVWLGVADEGTEAAFELLERLARLPRIDDATGSRDEVRLRPGSTPDQTCKLVVLNEHVECLYSSLDVGVRRVLQAGYWNRAWIIQEATTPLVDAESDDRQLVWCGGHTMRWKSLVEANYKLVEASWNNHVLDRVQLQDIVSQPLCALDYLQRRRKAARDTGPEETLYTTMVRSRSAAASDARDKLYAMLGLVKESASYGIQPDYTLDTSIMFINLAKSIIETTKSLDCLGSASLIRDYDVPSWVPCWTVQHAIVPQPFFQQFRSFNRHDESISRELPLFVAARGIEPVVSFSEGNRCLTARGLCFDIIVEDSEPRQWLSRQKDTTELWKSWVSVARCSADEIYVTGRCSSFTAFSKVLTTDVKNVSGSWSASRGSSTPRFVDKSINAFDLRDGLIDAMTHNRRLFRTAMGYLGLTAATAEVGDTVCILFGSQMPVVMRSNDECWTFVGQAYVHGIMDGEVVTRRNLLDGIRDFEIKSKRRDGRPASLDCTHLDETEGIFSPVQPSSSD